MIPVELRLSNFLSYGAAPPVLDFEQFHVACLSGRNGQGKSALLDALTWSVWGEARKSSDSRKPDDELLRTGASRMQVELVCDVDGSRYRIVRGYARSGSGKTNKTLLEFFVQDAESEGWRPLTGITLRETQEKIEQVVGLDYDTFINSAFLMQGRSDEFTKKKPNERKDILARILNLGRYDALAEIARERERRASDQLEQAEQEIERLSASLEQEPRYQSAREELLVEVGHKQEAISALRAEERRLTERLAYLDARSQEAQATERALASLRQRTAQLQSDDTRLRGRLAEADALIAQRTQIERDYDRHQTLQQERDDLDTKSHIYRGLEKQIEQREAEMRERRLDLEKRLHAFEVDLRANRTALAECDAQLIEAPATRRALEGARAAQRRLEQMNAVLQQRKAVEDDLARVEQGLLAQRESLNGEVKALIEQNAQAQAELPDLKVLETEKGRLATSAEQRAQVQQKLERTLEEGQKLAESIKECEGELSIRRTELAKQQDNYARFLEAGADGTCPTCGTRLSPERRAEVDVHYRESIRTAEREIASRLSEIEKHTRDREKLRAGFRSLQAQVDALQDVPERLAKVEEKIQCYHDDLAKIEHRRGRIEEVQRTIEEKRFGQELRLRWRELRAALDKLPFDEAAFEEARTASAQVPRYEDQLRQLEQVAGRRDQVERAAAQAEQQAQALRTQLDDGSAFGPIQDQIRRLKEQLVAVGFDAARLEQVRAEIRTLAEAGNRMKDLVSAQQSAVEWREQLARTTKELADAEAERTALERKLDELSAEVRNRPALEAERAERHQALKLEEDALHLLQVQLGEVSARLEQIRQDREALGAWRADHSEMQHQRALYRHLRTAFSRQGIPSLIIEETLPALEDRANELLDRISDGKMHVKLETLKDKKTGGTKETLDINILDEVGSIRAYETFSGGEAFRVNFALRIALSQLLAERSGVRIRTLFIDEGFGTQDAQGVQSMIEAIQSIQEDFDKILVITHLDELKEAFPVRIEVEKDPVEGSAFEVHGV